MQFPWMMYRKGPGLALPHGQSVECQAALDAAEYSEAITEGWFPSVPEALAEKLNAPVAAEKPAPVAKEPPAKPEASKAVEPVAKSESKDDGSKKTVRTRREDVNA